ncbi:hypothetical protein [Acinetobacter baumannii]|uniref:hypothetical protein n=1 Tax=Acinetobacter baumannii TaxID=470 RepID=UPI003AF4E612
MAYQCKTIDSATNQCLEWVMAVNLQDFAITGTQAAAICVAIASFFGVCWILKESRRAVK